MREILEKLLNGKIDINQCENLLKANNLLELEDSVKLDLSRQNRTGFPEAIFSQGKSHEDLVLIINAFIENLDENSKDLIFTRLDDSKFKSLENNLKERNIDFEYNKKANILVIKSNNSRKKKGKVGILTAGTSDIPVAEEVRVIVEGGGCETIYSYDVGVAGIHRLFPKLSKMLEEDVKVIIVCAGMEGALPSVVAGLVDVPVVAVPTSVGYGVGEGGKTALYAMLQSCAPGIAVVNIDNGFGAAVFALSIINNI
ncbi:nickel pincer cofactor biosynthesis protein LarB [Methanobrevibacter sp. OttesenSCG-928-K11]|nr:nickel pincer cofactor biosynthesis protein LarB [Methanobrevibacter sp. OttesenSCG-928-K11]MDL2271293.1 nickel pincer cofactor biosynthesis protein LarB [Methanobrevibacter sp. OttesenSCG-928-I08]